MKLRERLVDWLMRDDIKAISTQFKNFDSYVPLMGGSRVRGLMWSFLDAHRDYLRVKDINEAQLSIIGNFQEGNRVAQNTIDGLYADTVALMPESMHFKWRSKLGLPVMPGETIEEDDHAL